MKTQIDLQTLTGPLPWPAIVRGDLALHTTPGRDNASALRRGALVCWTVTHIPTGLAVLSVVGCRAGRTAFRSVKGLDFSKPDARLLKKINALVRRLRRAGIETVFPRPGKFLVGPPNA